MSVTYQVKDDWTGAIIPSGVIAYKVDRSYMETDSDTGTQYSMFVTVHVREPHDLADYIEQFAADSRSLTIYQEVVS